MIVDDGGGGGLGGVEVPDKGVEGVKVANDGLKTRLFIVLECHRAGDSRKVLNSQTCPERTTTHADGWHLHQPPLSVRLHAD